jgi:hypothetical protein
LSAIGDAPAGEGRVSHVAKSGDRWRWVKMAREVDKHAAGLSQTGAHVLQVLAAHSDEKGECFPSHGLLARETGMTDRSVRTAIACLRELGVIDTERGRQHVPNRYRLNHDMLAAMPKAHAARGVAPTPKHGPTDIRSSELNTPPIQPPTLAFRVPLPSGLNLLSESGRAKEKKKRGSRLGEGWMPRPETIERFRLKERVDASACLERFRNYFLSAPGSKGIKVDWDRTFVNWVLEEIDRGRARPFTASSAQLFTPPAKSIAPPEPTLAEREESRRLLRAGHEVLEAKLEADRQIVNGGTRVTG